MQFFGRMKGSRHIYLSGVPNDNMIILDLSSEQAADNRVIIFSVNHSFGVYAPQLWWH